MLHDNDPGNLEHLGIGSQGIGKYLEQFEDRWIETVTGHKYHFVNPFLNDITLKDLRFSIAAGLANEARFSGQTLSTGVLLKGEPTTIHWSVASHTLLLLEWFSHKHPDLKESHDVILAILLHDSPEAVLKDIPSPVKEVLGPIYSILQQRNEEYIFRLFGVCLSEQEAAAIKVADKEVLLAEAECLMPSKGMHWGFRKDYAPADISGCRINPRSHYRPDQVCDEYLSLLKHYS